MSELTGDGTVGQSRPGDMDAMTKAILTSSPGSHYKDLSEIQYHFPRTYSRQVEVTAGDWIIISLNDDYHLLADEKDLPAGAKTLIVPAKQIGPPETPDALPHPAFLRWHRDNVYHGLK